LTWKMAPPPWSRVMTFGVYSADNIHLLSSTVQSSLRRLSGVGLNVPPDLFNWPRGRRKEEFKPTFFDLRFTSVWHTFFFRSLPGVVMISFLPLLHLSFFAMFLRTLAWGPLLYVVPLYAAGPPSLLSVLVVAGGGPLFVSRRAGGFIFLPLFCLPTPAFCTWCWRPGYPPPISNCSFFPLFSLDCGGCTMSLFPPNFFSTLRLVLLGPSLFGTGPPSKERHDH